MSSPDESKVSNLRNLRSRPVCIICGRPAEALQIAQALGIDQADNRLPGHVVEKVNDGHTFYLGEFVLPDNSTLKYYVTSSLRQGIQSFTISAALLFNTLNPRFVVHTGVCAGYRDPSGKLRIELGDVVFGEAAINYEEGKTEVIEGKSVFRPDYNRVSAETGDMQAFAESKDRPMFHYGEYISGSAVRSDAHLQFEKIRSRVNRNAIALDMEASAFFELCKHLGPQGLKCLGVLKGVSDFGDHEKGKDPDAYTKALNNTADALKTWILHLIPSVDWEVDENDEAAARIVTGYYDNFVRRVLDNHSEGLRARVRDTGVEIPPEEIQGLKSVLPQGRQPWIVKELWHVQKVMKTYGIVEVQIGSQSSNRTLWYKGGYFIDWCRTVNSLENSDDPVHQVGVFERLLKKQPYYRASGDAEPLATVVTWEETMTWLEDVVKAERKAQAVEERVLVPHAVTMNMNVAAPAGPSTAVEARRQGETKRGVRVGTSSLESPLVRLPDTRTELLMRRMKSVVNLFHFKREGTSTTAVHVREKGTV